MHTSFSFTFLLKQEDVDFKHGQVLKKEVHVWTTNPTKLKDLASDCFKRSTSVSFFFSYFWMLIRLFQAHSEYRQPNNVLFKTFDCVG